MIKEKDEELSIWLASKSEKDVMDVARLLIMYLISTFLFSNLNPFFALMLPPYIYKYKQMKNVYWSATTGKHLMEQERKNKESTRKIRAYITPLLGNSNNTFYLS